MRRAGFAGLAMALTAVLATTMGCGRRARVEYPRADSLGVLRTDSALVRAREAQLAWDAPGGGEAAAKASMDALSLALAAAPPESWGSRAQAFLDSLGIGAELAGDTGALAVNFFSRADPSVGSWPYLVWLEDAGPRSQAIEGRSMRLAHLASRGLPAGTPGDSVPPAIAVLYERRASRGSEPLLMLWRRQAKGKGWDLAQTLGPDSLGGAGSGEFEMSRDTLRMVTRTYRANRGFEECGTCPHLFHVRRFTWVRDGFVRLSEEEVPSPYATFVRFVQALVAADRATAETLVTDRALVDAAQAAGFGLARGLWRVAPATDETATHIVFHRGASEAWDVAFQQLGAGWSISGIAPAQRQVE